MTASEATIHEAALRRLGIHRRISTRRIDGDGLREIARDAVCGRSGRQPRLGLDSDRLGNWFLGLGCRGDGRWGWWVYAAARADLGRRGWPDDLASRVARAAATNDYGYFAPVTPADDWCEVLAPPAGVPCATTHDLCGWDRRRTNMTRRSAEEAARVRAWSGWLRSLDCTSVQVGARSRRWLRACVRAVKRRCHRGQRRRDHAATQWLDEQADEVRSAYEAVGARPTCLRVAAGQTAEDLVGAPADTWPSGVRWRVIESLHDVGGTMATDVDGELAEILAERQAGHDAVYHPAAEDSRWWGPRCLSEEE